MLGQTLAGRYKIVKHLGGGSFGQTFLAEDLLLPGNPLCVVKQLKPQSTDPFTLQTASRLFVEEAKVLTRLGEHDQIPRLLAYFEENQEFVLVQQYIEGDELSKEIKPGQQWSEERVIALLYDILNTLSFVHQEKVIHRDLKPANLIRRRKDGKIVIIDFGAVKQIGTQLANPQGQPLSVGVGTPGYMPNEQSSGRPKLCSDIYALGMTAIQALTGISPIQLPDDSRTGEIIWRDKARVSPKFADILDKMVRHDFRQRYPSAAEALQAIYPLTKTDAQTRRQFIKIAGFGGVGLIAAVFAHQAFQEGADVDVEKPINPQPEPSATAEETIFPQPLEEQPTTSPQKPQLQKPSGIPLTSFAFEVVTVDAKGKETNRQRSQAQYLPEDLGNGVSLEMVGIPAGTFLMGSPETEQGRYSSESPQHRVTVQSFFMGKYAVTQAQWQAVMGTNPSNFKGDKRPVEQVSWNDAVEFCSRLSKKTGRTYRLPSEAEWEYACRAGTTTPFHFGETITPELVNYNGNYPYASAPKGLSRGETTDVGSFPPNAFGLYDVHGNVWEWCADPWHGNYNGAPSDGSVWEAGGNDSLVLRGGSWLSNAVGCRGACRSSNSAGDSNGRCGFRVAVAFLLPASWFPV